MIRLESNGVRTPQPRPYTGPHTNPHSNTGICIGSRMLPAFGMECRATGSTTPSAAHSAAITSCLAFV